MTPPSKDNDSIRERLQAPAPNSEANSGGDSRESHVHDSNFQQTYSGEELAASGNESQTMMVSGVQPVDEPSPELDAYEAKMAERKVAGLFLLSVLAVLAFVVWYFVGEEQFGEGGYYYYTPILGSLMAIALFGIGAGAVVWGKTLMTHEVAVQERHPFGSPAEARADVAEALQRGVADAGVKRRPLLLGTLVLGMGSLALLPLPFVFGMGRFQNKEAKLAETAWREGMRLYRSNGTPVRLGDLQIGGVESVFPPVELPQLRADSPVLLIRMRPEELLPGVDNAAEWAYEGHVAYSSICTHLGCPVKLYEQQTHYLFCPCHQSTFDAAQAARVVFGPAARPLPQLPIGVDEEGFFVALSDFPEPIGPSYWERGD